MSYSDKIYLKIILAGEAGVGKTSLRRTYLGHGFQKDHLSTIGADFASLPKVINDVPTMFQIWDVAGQEIFEKMRMMYYRGALGALIVFDVTNASTFKVLDKWIDELQANTGRGIVPFFIIGNKTDLISDNEIKKVESQLRSYISKLNKKYAGKGFEIKYYLTSALTGDNVHIAFENLGEEIFSYLDHRKKKRGSSEHR
ncbi:MAG: Rab family GTPase [Candidatus Heimdallarchaeaceae archaeon]